MNRIKELRNLKMIKQSDFARRFNVTQATLSNWERGVHDPDNESLKRMAEYFDTTIDYILGIDDDPKLYNKKITLSPEKQKMLNRIGYAYYGGEDKEITEKDVDDMVEILEMARKLREKRNNS